VKRFAEFARHQAPEKNKMVPLVAQAVVSWEDQQLSRVALTPEQEAVGAAQVGEPGAGSEGQQ
jgi:hypothetical protein